MILLNSIFDNALFIRNWRERMRLHLVGSAAFLTAIIIILIFLGNYLNKDIISHYNYATKTELKTPWINSALFQLTIFQGFILLLFGTISAGRMASIEKTSGTLDFHRSSPTPKFNQFLGILLGAPALEWCVFLATSFIFLIVIIIAKIQILDCILFYVSLTITALFLHSFSILYMLSGNKRLRIGGLFFTFYFCMSGFFLLSCLYQITPFPAYERLSHILIDSNKSPSAWDTQWQTSLNSFFGYTISFPLLQLIIQLPLIMLFALGICRKFEYTERPVWTKAQSAIFTALTLFFFSGSIVNFKITGQHYSRGAMLIPFWLIAFIVIFTTASMATPNYLSFVKGLHRARKMKVLRLSGNDDYSSNWLWLITSCLTSSVIFYITILFSGKPNHHQLVQLVTGLSYIVFYAQILEYFNSSKYHQKKALFISGLILLWLIIPIFGVISKPVIKSHYYLQYFFAPSPFFGTYMLQEWLLKNDADIAQPLVFIIISSTLALSAILLARNARSRVKKSISNLISE